MVNSHIVILGLKACNSVHTVQKAVWAQNHNWSITEICCTMTEIDTTRNLLRCGEFKTKMALVVLQS